MTLTLKLRHAKVLPDEAVPVHLTLVNGPAPLTLPVLLDESDALVVQVRSATGDVLRSASGHDRVRRGPLGRSPIPDMPTDSFPAGETGEIEFDLLEFLDLPGPGTYQVSVSLRCGITALQSVPVRLEILNCPIVSIDGLTSYYGYLAATHRLDQGVRAVVRIVQNPDPTRVLLRWAADLPPGIAPILSRVDPEATGNVEGDLSPWLGWVQDGKLGLLQVRCEEPLAEILYPALNFKVTRLIDRPLQRRDSSISVVLGTPTGIRRIWVNRTGKVEREEAVSGVEQVPGDGVAFVAPKENGTLDIGTLSGQGFPLILRESRGPASRELTVQPRGDNQLQIPGLARVLSLKLLNSVAPSGPKAACAVFVSTPTATTLRILRANWPAKWPSVGASDRAATDGIEFDTNCTALEQGESIVAADVAQAPAVLPAEADVFRMCAAVRTSRGRVFAGVVDQELRAFDQADPSSSVTPLLLTMADGSVLLTVPSKEGRLSLFLVEEAPVL